MPEGLALPTLGYRVSDSSHAGYEILPTLNGTLLQTAFHNRHPFVLI